MNVSSEAVPPKLQPILSVPTLGPLAETSMTTQWEKYCTLSVSEIKDPFEIYKKL